MNNLNWKSIGTALGILIVGIILILIDVFRDNVQEPYVWISIGCSLIASALVIL